MTKPVISEFPYLPPSCFYWASPPVSLSRCDRSIPDTMVVSTLSGRPTAMQENGGT